MGVFDAGLLRTIINDDTIHHGRWLRACAEGSFVGECRACGGYLRPYAPFEHGDETGNFDYEAECVGCGHTVLAPRGRVLRGSGRHGQMPKDWWGKRNESLRREAS